MSAPKPIREKLKQPTPASLVYEIMVTIREVYCPGMPDDQWFKTNERHVKEWCVLWPAKFIVSKHFTLPSDRFKEILVDIITDSKRNCTGTITYLPAYLGKCIQSHFEKRWEIYYNEAKSIALKAESALLAMKQLPQADRTVEHIAAVADVLKTHKRKAKLAKPGEQPTLF